MATEVKCVYTKWPNPCACCSEAGVCANAPLGKRTDDLVNHPPHYTAGAVECIDAIESALGRDGFMAYCRGQIIKYTWRTGLKGHATEDAKKAQWYAARAIATMEKT